MRGSQMMMFLWRWVDDDHASMLPTIKIISQLKQLGNGFGIWNKKGDLSVGQDLIKRKKEM